jgi:hypothetical protein
VPRLYVPGAQAHRRTLLHQQVGARLPTTHMATKQGQRKDNDGQAHEAGVRKTELAAAEQMPVTRRSLHLLLCSL